MYIYIYIYIYIYYISYIHVYIQCGLYFTVHKWNNSNNLFFQLTTRMFWQWMLRQRQPIQLRLIDNINTFLYFLQQRHLQWFLLRIRSHNYVCLVIILTQEEEYNKGFRQLSVEFSIDFVHFIHPYINPWPRFLVSECILKCLCHCESCKWSESIHCA